VRFYAACNARPSREEGNGRQRGAKASRPDAFAYDAGMAHKELQEHGKAKDSFEQAEKFATNDAQRESCQRRLYWTELMLKKDNARKEKVCAINVHEPRPQQLSVWIGTCPLTAVLCLPLFTDAASICFLTRKRSAERARRAVLVDKETRAPVR